MSLAGSEKPGRADAGSDLFFCKEGGPGWGGGADRENWGKCREGEKMEVRRERARRLPMREDGEPETERLRQRESQTDTHGETEAAYERVCKCVHTCSWSV